MAQLSPCPFDALVRRMFRELDTRGRIFDLPERAFVVGDPALDCSVRFHARSVAAPFGPAAGPHTQLAQNIVLSWLAGGRIIELKTVQANDRLTIPRPCIDTRTIAFNVEWSQELTLEQSLEEYVKGSMLIQMLIASGRIALAPGFERFTMDMSVGYDFAGITSDRVLAFVRSMRDATPVIERLRREIPSDWQHLADLPFDSCVGPSITLSTFHGCPPAEIGRIVEFLLRDIGSPVIVKLNPTLLGFDAVRRLIHEELGYSDIRLTRTAFDNDLHWDEMCGLVDHLGRVAEERGLGFGVKFANTLVVENDGDFLPSSEPKKYMSGPPLHVLAMHLVRRFRREFGSRLPVSFSGGIDATNYPDAVALGLTPVTVCTDLLRANGYARGQKYFRELARRMTATGASSISSFMARAYGQGEGHLLRNTEHYVASVAGEPRYAWAQNCRPPRKVGRRLARFDCLTCDKCIPACPNDANFTFVLPPEGIRCETACREDGVWRVFTAGTLPVRSPHQVANFADVCNECGNCDVVCPEDGGPFSAKPRFFGSIESWQGAAPADGFVLERAAGADVLRARLSGEEYRAEIGAGRVRYIGRGFDLEFAAADLETTLRGVAVGPVDLTPYHLMHALLNAVLAVPGSNFVNSIQ